MMLLVRAMLLLLPLCAVGQPQPALAPDSAAYNKVWTLQVNVPRNCSASATPDPDAPALLACSKPCNVTGGTSFSVQKGSSLTVAFQARPGVVITGGSSKLGFMDDPFEDLEVHTAAAPPNPITHVTFTGFQFTPKRNYYQTFQSGTSAKLAIYAFDATRPSRNKTNGVLGMYESASCRIALDLHLVSPPPNVTVSTAQLSPTGQSQQSSEWQYSRTTAIVVPSVVGGFLAIVLLGCLALGLANKSSEAASKC